MLDEYKRIDGIVITMQSDGTAQPGDAVTLVGFGTVGRGDAADDLFGKVITAYPDGKVAVQINGIMVLPVTASYNMYGYGNVSVDGNGKLQQGDGEKVLGIDQGDGYAVIYKP